MLYSIANKSGSRREIKKIKNIRSKASKRGRHSSRGSSSDYLDSDSLLARDSSLDTYRQTAGRKEINRLDHVVTYNLKNNKDQINEAIKSEPKFDTSNFNLSSSTSDPLPVVTFFLHVVKKRRSNTVSGLTCL